MWPALEPEKFNGQNGDIKDESPRSPTVSQNKRRKPSNPSPVVRPARRNHFADKNIHYA